MQQHQADNTEHEPLQLRKASAPRLHYCATLYAACLRSDQL